MCLILSWNTTFLTMCIAVLLSPYSLMGHSWRNQSMSINLWSRSALMFVLKSELDRETTLCFLLFHDTRFFFKKDTISCGWPPIRRAPCPVYIEEACYSSVSMIWIEKSSPWSFLQSPQNPHYPSKSVVLGAEKTDSLCWLRRWCLVWSPSVFLSISCTFKHPQEASLIW